MLHAAVLGVAQAVREGLPSAATAVLEDAAVRDANVGPGIVAVERDAPGFRSPSCRRAAPVAGSC